MTITETIHNRILTRVQCVCLIDTFCACSQEARNAWRMSTPRLVEAFGTPEERAAHAASEARVRRGLALAFAPHLA